MASGRSHRSGRTGISSPSSVAVGHGEDADAGALAAAFAVDFMSWDEADPARRGRALASYAALSADEEELAVAGWSGRGRQRAELALPGTLVHLSAARVLVHVRVRVTPFRRRPDGSPDLHGSPAAGHVSGDLFPFPASAPAPAHPRWEGLDSYWYELLIPLDREDQWRIDIGAVIVVPPVPEGGADADGQGS